MPLLDVENLHVGYGELEVVHGVSFGLNEGEIITILGSNGAGKSTTLRSLTGLTPSKKGTVRFAGQHIEHLSAHKIAAAGLVLVPEGRQLFPDHTVGENLELGAFCPLSSGRRDEFEQSLTEVFELFPRVRERFDQPAGLLSGGEQQMVAIARALMSKPKLLLLDEPSLGLAPLIVRSIFDTFLRLKSHGLTILLVEQMAWLALEICDRAYVLDSGKIVLSGTPTELASDPRVMEAYLGAGVSVQLPQ